MSMVEINHHNSLFGYQLVFMLFSWALEILALYFFPSVPKQLSCLQFREEKRGDKLQKNKRVSQETTIKVNMMKILSHTGLSQ